MVVLGYSSDLCLLLSRVCRIFCSRDSTWPRRGCCVRLRPGRAGAGHRRRHRVVAGVMTMAFVMVESGAAVARWCTGACVRQGGDGFVLASPGEDAWAGGLADVRDGIVLERGGSGIPLSRADLPRVW